MDRVPAILLSHTKAKATRRLEGMEEVPRVRDILRLEGMEEVRDTLRLEGMEEPLLVTEVTPQDHQQVMAASLLLKAMEVHQLTRVEQVGRVILEHLMVEVDRGIQEGTHQQTRAMVEVIPCFHPTIFPLGLGDFIIQTNVPPLKKSLH